MVAKQVVGIVVIVGIIMSGCRGSEGATDAADELDASGGSTGEDSSDAKLDMLVMDVDTDDTDTDDTDTDDMDLHDLDPIDCSALPASPLSVRQLDAPRGVHDVAFDGRGHILGSDTVSLVEVDAADNLSVLAFDIGYVEQMDWIEGGDLAVAVSSDKSITRVSPAGVTSVITPDVGAYGLITGDDGMLYAANYHAVLRIDPDSGASEVVVSTDGLAPRVVGFSPDNTRLYIGTGTDVEPIPTLGHVYAVDWDPETMEPIGEPYVFATGVGTGDYHDTMAVDACGNLYISDVVSFNMYRVSPSGEVEVYIDFYRDMLSYGHGARFGRGEGWREDALYMPQPYSGYGVMEVVIGVPSREHAHLTMP